MAVFKDFLRVCALILIVFAVVEKNIVYAVCAGTLYMGGFGDQFALWQAIKGKRAKDPGPPEANVLEQAAVVAAAVVELQQHAAARKARAS